MRATRLLSVTSTTYPVRRTKGPRSANRPSQTDCVPRRSRSALVIFQYRTPGCGIHAPVSPGNREQMLVAALGTTSPANPGTLSFRSLQCRFIVTQKQRPGSRNQDFSASGCRLFTHPVPTRHPKRRPVHKPLPCRPYFAPRDDHAPNASQQCPRSHEAPWPSPDDAAVPAWSRRTGVLESRGRGRKPRKADPRHLSIA